MKTGTRKLFNHGFTGLSIFSIILMAGALVVLLGPIFVRGMRAYVFEGTIEYRRMMLDKFGRGNRAEIEREWRQVRKARQPVYDDVSRFEKKIKSLKGSERRKYRAALDETKKAIRELFGPFPGRPRPVLIRLQYGQTRWDRARVKLKHLLYRTEYDYSNPDEMGKKFLVPRANDFKGTSVEPMFTYIPEHIEAMFQPRWTFYWRFLFDESKDAHFFGGIWPEVLGTFYLTVGAILFAVPVGVLSAVYLTQYARPNRFIRVLRGCISTLAGVPSIVFGLFGLAFFINTMHVSSSKSVLAGSLTLALLILPVIIRASEEAILTVPRAYKEAALSLGTSKWRTIVTVILPAALPGILTGIVISMGRAAGETAPIIFTAAVSVGKPLYLWQTLSQPSPALPWNIYNLCTEHEAVDEIRHVQYGMVLTLILLVLFLNAMAIVLRARISKKLKG